MSAGARLQCTQCIKLQLSFTNQLRLCIETVFATLTVQFLHLIGRICLSCRHGVQVTVETVLLSKK